MLHFNSFLSRIDPNSKFIYLLLFLCGEERCDNNEFFICWIYPFFWNFATFTSQKIRSHEYIIYLAGSRKKVLNECQELSIVLVIMHLSSSACKQACIVTPSQFIHPGTPRFHDVSVALCVHDYSLCHPYYSNRFAMSHCRWVESPITILSPHLTPFLTSAIYSFLFFSSLI